MEEMHQPEYEGRTAQHLALSAVTAVGIIISNGCVGARVARNQPEVKQKMSMRVLYLIPYVKLHHERGINVLP